MTDKPKPMATVYICQVCGALMAEADGPDYYSHRVYNTGRDHFLAPRTAALAMVAIEDIPKISEAFQRAQKGGI